MNSSVPCSPFNETSGLVYFPRLIDKIRLHARGELRADLHENMGKGIDGWLCDFLHVDYVNLVVRVHQGGTDEEILSWCQQQNRPLNDGEKFVWRGFVTKLGWNDLLSTRLVQRKAESNLSDRDEIQTMMQYIDADEGRA